MDLTRLAVDAGQFINRAVQYTGETIGTADRTELEPDLDQLLAKADATKTHTDQIITQTEALLQPNPAARIEDRLFEQLEWRVQPRPRSLEVLGDLMTNAGLELGSNTTYGSALVKVGETQKQLGEAERKFAQSTNIHFLTALRNFSEKEYKVIQDERRTLINKRLDLDIAKTRLRKAHEADQEARNLNANPMEEDYLAHVSYMFSFLRVKWLKMWAQEISQAEMELRICQSLFDRQSEITKQLLEGLSDTHMNHMQSLNEFVETQTFYFDECNQLAQELHKQLQSVSAVLCSNNWQSAITNGVSQTATGNDVLEELSESHHQDSSVVLHRIPDFDQDSWTIKTDTEKMPQSRTESSHNHSNMNNSNNNSFLSGDQATAHSSAANRSTSNLEPKKHYSPLQRTDTTTISDDPNDDSDLIETGADGEDGIALSRLSANTVETVITNDSEADPEINGKEEDELPPTEEEDIKDPN